MADAAAESLVAGRFRIVGLLGSGGTASVYEAEDVLAGRRVALKVLHPHLAADPALRQAFLREAQRVSGIQHPALCAAAAWGETDTGMAWTAWQRASGRSLAEIVRDRGPLDARTTVAIASRVAEGLAALHAAGLVHRDVSPANIVVDLAGDGRVRDARLIDFGLADASGQTARGADVLRSEAGDGVVGNAFYASPEQLQGQPITATGDLYALAGVVYFALVGVSAFARPEVADTVAAQLVDLPPTPSVRARGVPPALDRAVVRGLMKDPDARFADAHAMRDALVDAVEIGRPRTASVAETRTRVLGATPVADAERRPAAAVTVDGGAAAEPRTTSPWLWVLAAAAVTVIVAVAALSLRPSAAPADARIETPAPATPTASSEPSATPTSAPVSPSPPSPRAVPVPPVTGEQMERAVTALGEAGLAVGTVRSVDGTAAAGTVLGTAPDAGTPLPPGALVELTVASGANTLPAVAGLSEQEAVARVQDAGFVAVVTRASRPAAAGSVAESLPAAGARMPVGSSVTVVVAEPQPTPTAPSPRPSATATPEARP